MVSLLVEEYVGRAENCPRTTTLGYLRPKSASGMPRVSSDPVRRSAMSPPQIAQCCTLQSMSALQIFVTINGLMGCLMSAVVYFLSKNTLIGVSGSKEWVLFPLLSFIASILYAFQGGIHHLLSMALPNFFVVTSIWLQVLGTHRFFGKSLSKTPIYISIGISIAFFLFTSGKPEYFKERVMFVSGMAFVVSSINFPLLWSNRRTGIAAWLMLFTLTVFNAVMLVRFITAWTLGLSGSIYDFGIVQAAYLGIFSFGVVLLGISSILFISERNRQTMERMLNEDILTGAKSRRSIIEMLEYEFERMRRLPGNLSIMMIDMDNFKKINDTHGHVVGDAVLKNYVKTTKETLRAPSDIGRYGGEEFLIVLPDTDADQALQVAERIREAVAKNQSEIPKYSVSIGIHQWKQGICKNIDEFIQRADFALYKAKEAGRDRVILLE